MNRIIASLLIVFIFSMHSAWAIGVHGDSNHVIDSTSHVESSYHKTADNSDEDCGDHGCHISAHATGLFSIFDLVLGDHQQDTDTTIKLSRYFYSQIPPQRPPKV